MSAEVFVSYCSRDRPVAEMVRQALEQRGRSCWMAPRDILPGSWWPDQIMEAINHCRVMVVVVSRHANDSPQVKREIACGVDRKLFVVPYRIEDIQPSGGMEYFLRVTHWLDAINDQELGPLQVLADIVAGSLLSHRPAERKRVATSDAQDAPAALDQEQQDRILLRLADEMVRQKEMVVDFSQLTHAEQALVWGCLDAGLLRQHPSPRSVDLPLVSYRSRDQAERMLARWIASARSLSPGRLLELGGQLPPLVDGIARHVVDQWESAGKDLLVRCAACHDESIGRLVESIACRWKGANRPFDQLLDSALESDRFACAWGVAAAGKRYLEQGDLSAAEQLLVRAQSWAESKTDPEKQTFGIEVLNERGRVRRRGGDWAGAETLFRQAIGRAGQVQAHRLEAVATNNLAQVLLEAPQAGNSRLGEAVALLEENVGRLVAPSSQDRGESLGTAAHCHPSHPSHPSSSEMHLAVAYHHLGNAYAALEPARAESYYRKDIDLCRRMNEDLALVDALDGYGIFLADQRRYREAQKVHGETLEILEHHFDMSREGRATANLGRSYLGAAAASGDREQLDHAVIKMKRACDLLSTLDDARLLAPALENLGRAQYLAGTIEDGICSLRRAIEQYNKWPAGTSVARQIEDELDQLG